MLERFFHQKIMRPINLLEQIRNFQHSATLLPKFSLIFLQITSFKAIIEKTKYKISAQNNVLQNAIDSKLGHLKQHFKMLISCWFFGIITLACERIVYAEKLHTLLN